MIYIFHLINSLKLELKFIEKEMWKFNKKYITNKYIKRVLNKHKI